MIFNTEQSHCYDITKTDLARRRLLTAIKLE
jgi:hypothetical protein